MIMDWKQPLNVIKAMQKVVLISLWNSRGFAKTQRKYIYLAPRAHQIQIPIYR